MGILDELAEKFAITLDSKLCSDSEYLRAMALLHDFAEGLYPEQSAELDDIAGRLTSASFNMLTSEKMKATPIAKAGTFDKPEFVKDGILDVQLILTKFIAHFHEIYGDKPEKFIEDDGRKCFLIYLRPIINGIGNYYVEAQTRDNRRMDIVIDYLGKRYIIELKIWHGQKYNENGEKQLSDYLDSYGLKTGYLLTFCFNDSKESGVKTVQFEDKTLIEAIV